MLLPLDGVPLARRAAANALDAGLSPLVVIIGRDAAAVRDALTGLPCHIVENDRYDGPTSGSLHLGLRHLASRVDGAVVLLGDMVAVTPAMIRSLVAAAAENGAPVGASSYAGVIAPPLFFARSLFDELLACEGDGCGKAVVQRHRAQAVLVDAPQDALRDVDTPEDWTRIQRTTQFTPM